MNDYIEDIKKMLFRFYSPIRTENSDEEFKTTTEILSMVRGIIPETPIDQHDIYEVMNTLNFQIDLIDSVFQWKMYRS